MLKQIKKLFSSKKKKTNIQIIIIAVAVIMIRRGVRGLLDIFLFPNNHILSYAISITIGIIILYLDDKRIDELGHH